MKEKLIILGSNCPFDEFKSDSCYVAARDSIKKFNNGEIRVELYVHDREFSFEMMEEVVIIQSISDPIHASLFEVMIIADALKRAGVRNITLLATHLAYMRQDRRMNSHMMYNKNYIEVAEPVTVKLIANLIETSGINKVMILEPHFMQCESLFNHAQIKIIDNEYFIGFLEQILEFFTNNSFFKSLGSTIDLLSQQKKYQIGINELNAIAYAKTTFIQNFQCEKKDIIEAIDFLENKLTLVAPDAGALKKLRDLKKILVFYVNRAIEFWLYVHGRAPQEECLKLNDINIAFVEKSRPAPGESSALTITGNIEDQVCLIIDDILDSGGTLINAANFLQNSGALSISAFMIHGIFSGHAITNLEASVLEKVFVTNSIDNSKKSLGEKIVILDIKKFIHDFII